jgi:CRP/FNR family transcriptional regulator, cyclic AMP receptor protein
VLPDFEKDEVDFLSLLSEANRRKVLESSTRAEYPPGAIAYSPESPPRAFLLDRGLARAYVSVPDGRQATCTFFHSKELIGGTTIVSHPPRILVQVVVKSILISLDLPMVRKLAATENQVTGAVAVHLAALVRSAFRLIAVRSLGDIRQRLAYDLLDRACRSQLEVGRLEARATHADLADSIGSAREVVGRTLSRLREEGIVETVPGLVRVVDPLRMAGIVRAFAF